MKKIILSYLGGIATAIAVIAAVKLVEKNRIIAVFDGFPESPGTPGSVVSTFETRDWAFAELEREQRGKPFPTSDYFFKPKDSESGFRVGFHFQGSRLEQIWIAEVDEENKIRQVVVRVRDANELEDVSIHGSKFISFDKNVDGQIDLQGEAPLGAGRNLTYFTSNGVVHGVSGQAFTDEDSGKHYSLRWDGDDWARVFEN